MDIRLSDRVIGATIENIALNDITDAQFAQIRDLVHERSVVAIRGQKVSEAEQVRFAARFGPLQKIFLKEALSPDHPELFYVSNILKDGKPIGSMDAGKFWHTDGAFFEKPHNVSMLYAIEVPNRDGKPLGDTDFIGMGAAYDALPEATRRRIDGLRAVHSLYHRYEQTVDAEEMIKRATAFPPMSHPLVMRHPATGRPCLYVSEGYTTHIEGLPAQEGAELLQMLCEHVVRPDFRLRYAWSVGDLVIWDNRATLHRANFDYALPERRLMRRATVSGESLG